MSEGRNIFPAFADNAHPMTDTVEAASRSSLAFDSPVFLRLHDHWIFIDAVVAARHCLLDHFPDKQGPSHARALCACDLVLSGNGPSELARTTFVVAAMEAGFLFEIIDDAALAYERRIELEAENGLRSILQRLDDDPIELTDTRS